MRLDPNSLDTLLHPTLDEKSFIQVIANGLPASPGAASGKVVFTSEEAERLNDMMQDTILVRVETSPEDIQGMHAAKGILLLLNHPHPFWANQHHLDSTACPSPHDLEASLHASFQEVKHSL